MELEEKIKFQESTIVVASRDVDFCVKVDDDIHVHVALEVQSKELTKKLMMMQESTVHEVVAVGMDMSDPMVFDCGQTHTSTNGAAHVIKNVSMDLTVMHVGGNSIEFGLCYRGHILLFSEYHKAKELYASFLGDSCEITY